MIECNYFSQLTTRLQISIWPLDEILSPLSENTWKHCQSLLFFWSISVDLGKMTLVQTWSRESICPFSTLYPFLIPNPIHCYELWIQKIGKCIMHDNIIHLNWRCCHFPLPYSMTFCPILVLMKLTIHIWIHEYT